MVLWIADNELSGTIGKSVSSKVSVSRGREVSGSKSRADKAWTVGVEVGQVETDGSAGLLLLTVVTQSTVVGRGAEVPGSETRAGNA